MEVYDVVIIGAGISGLTLGRALKKQHKNFLILEKSNGLGGRMATRRIDGLGFDHGCPYFPDKPQLSTFLEEGKLDFVSSSQGLYLKQGMTKLPKFLSEGLPIQKGVKITTVKWNSPGWLLASDNGEYFRSKKVIFSGPAPQALDLLLSNNLNPRHEAELRSITYDKAIMALIISPGETQITPFDDDVHSIIEMKPRDLHPNGYVVRASPEFSAIHFDDSERTLCNYFRSLFLEISHIEIKKWRYSTLRNSLPYPYLEVLPEFFLMGDGFRTPDVNGAIESALALSQKLFIMK